MEVNKGKIEVLFSLIVTKAQSFSPFLARVGRQVCCPSWIWATSLCYILLNKFVALIGSGRQVCHPSQDKKGLKDWANVTLHFELLPFSNCHSFPFESRYITLCTYVHISKPQ
jgi:hypothetical protein